MLHGGMPPASMLQPRLQTSCRPMQALRDLVEKCVVTCPISCAPRPITLVCTAASCSAHRPMSTAVASCPVRHAGLNLLTSRWHSGCSEIRARCDTSFATSVLRVSGGMII